MRKHVLLGGSVGAVLLIAFLGGMQLGQVQMYENLIFGDGQNELYVKVVQHQDFLIKRYRDHNRIGIVEPQPEAQSLDPLKLSIQQVLEAIPGLDAFEMADAELMLFKLDGVKWQAILPQVFQALAHP